MSGLSLMMEMSGQRVLVAGAGAVGRSKAAKCAACGADVLMLSADAPAGGSGTGAGTPPVIRLSAAQAEAISDDAGLRALWAAFEQPGGATERPGRIFWAGVRLNETWLSDRSAIWWRSFLLVIPATDCADINQAVMRRAAGAGCLINPAAGQPDWPERASGGADGLPPERLVRFTAEIRRGPVTVSVSCGQAPALAQRFCDQLASGIPDWWETAALRLGEWRQCERLKQLPQPQRRMLIRRLADLLTAHRGNPDLAEAELARALTVRSESWPDSADLGSESAAPPAAPEPADLN